MNKFKKGDKVKKSDGSTFSNGGEVLTVEYQDTLGNVYFGETSACLPVCRVTLAYPNPPHKHAELIKAWADGAEIEVYYRHNGWSRIEVPSWGTDTTYRIKPSNPNAEKIAELEATISKAQQQLAELKESV